MAERTVPAQDAAPGSRAELLDQPGQSIGSDLIRRPDPLAVTTPTEFAHAFATLREQAGISVRDLARTVGATSSAIGAYFSGGQLPPPSATVTVERILGACGVPAGPARQSWIDALSRVRRLPGPRPPDVPEPYRGLESYGPEDAAYFFGRERLVARLVALVTSSTSAGPAMVLGPSGSGKTSALQAGLAARLGASSTWQVVSLTPGSRPLQSLEAALATITERKMPPGSRVLLIVDQFEELFALCASGPERREFVERLTGRLGSRPGTDPTVSVIIGLRAEFYGAALEHGALTRSLQDRQVVVGPMSDDDLRRAITEPARAAGVQVDPGLVELLLHDLPSADDATGPAAYKQGAAALPLMSFALLETWRHGGRSHLSVEDYVAVGGISGAVSATAETVYAALTPAQRELTRQLLLRLVAVSDAFPDTRRRATAAELGLDVPEGDAMSEVLERLVGARLLTTTETTVEIAHEALLAAWPRLRGWLDADRTGLVTRRRLADAANTWERDRRDPGSLHRGGALVSAREWAADPAHAGCITPTEQAFLAASVSAHERRQTATRRRRKRTQSLLAGVSTLAVVATTVSVVALVQRASAVGERDRALSRQLAETADRLRGTDPSVAGQLAVMAWDSARTAEARSAVLKAAASPLARRVPGPGGTATVAVSGNGRVLAAVGDQGGLRLWTVGRGQPASGLTEVATVPRGDERALYAVALDRDGTVVVAGGASGVLRAWDVRDPGRPAALPSASVSKTAIHGLTFSPDGSILAVALGDGRVLLYAVRPGQGAATLTALGTPLSGPAPGLAVQTVSFSADGRLLAAAGTGGRIQLWTLADRSRPQPLPNQLTGTTGTVTSLAFSPDGDRLVAGSKDQRAYVWALETPTVAPQRFDGATGWVNAVAFSPDGAFLAAAAADHHVRLYDSVSRALIADLPHPGAVVGATFVPEGGALATGSADGTVRVWPVPGPTSALADGVVLGLAQLADNRLATITSHELRFFDVSAPNQPRPLGAAVDRTQESGSSHPVTFSGAVAVDASGTLLATGSTDGTVHLYQAGDLRASGPAARLVATLPKTHQGFVEATAISPDGKTLVTTGGDGTLQVTDISTPTAPRPLAAPARTPGVTYAVAFAPDGQTIATGTGDPDAIVFWDLSSGDQPRRIGEPVAGPAQPVSSLAFSPDGETLVVGSLDRTVRLLDAGRPDRARWLGEPLLGAGDHIYDVDFGPDGHVVAAVAGDGTVRLWDAEDRDEPVVLATLDAGANEALFAVSFDRAQRRIAAAGSGAAVRQWTLDAGPASSQICSLAGAPVTRQEWARYVPSIDYSTPCGSG